MVATKLDFEQFALDHPNEKWEFHRGQPRRKPAMASGHDRAFLELNRQLIPQEDRSRFRVLPGVGRVARATTSYYIPDLCIVSAAQFAAFDGQPRAFHLYREPLLLVVEIWSPSTGPYDIDEKIPEYVARGDLEIWRLQPYQRRLTAWRRRPDGEYDVVEVTGGRIELHALPGVMVDLDALFVSEE
jgi:Uma2 family endonuclease